MDVFILDQVVHRSCGISFGFALGNDGLPDLDRLLNVGLGQINYWRLDSIDGVRGGRLQFRFFAQGRGSRGD